MNARSQDPHCTRQANIHAPVLGLAVPPRKNATSYPNPFRERFVGRQKRALGDHFGLHNFGVNLTRLPPGAMSALRHAHSRQDEFVFVLQGELMLVDESGRTILTRGMCIGFPAGAGNAHHFINESGADAIVLEIGDRSSLDEVCYPDDDLMATLIDGQWRMTRKDGTPY